MGLNLKAFLLGSCCITLLWSQRSRADELAVAKAQLNREIELTVQIEPYLERPELGRIFVLRQQSQRVLELLNTRGLAHTATMREYQVLIVAYRFSTAFFERIRTDETSSEIAELLQINEQIVADRGFDDSPYTKVTYSVFSQMHQLFSDLEQMSIQESVRTKIQDLLPDFGNVLSLAMDGDRPKTFEAAKGLYLKIRSLYPDFVQISGADPGFNLVLNIQGLAEFYAEYAQIN